MGAQVPTVLTGVRDGAELLSTNAPRRTETPPPIGFNYNCGPNYMPCVISDNNGRNIPAHFTRVVIGVDPHIIGMILGDRSQYGGPLHAIPNHDQGERPWYAYDDLWQFKIGTDNSALFDLALNFIHDLSLMAKVSCFCETLCLFTQYQEDICKLKVHMWEARQMKDASAHRLEGANALQRIEEALVKINCRQQRRQPLMECECST